MRCFFPCKDKSKSWKELKRIEPPKGNLDNLSTNSVSITRSVEEMNREKEHNLRVFTFQELKAATKGFDMSMLIGGGRFGSVYKGTIKVPNGEGDPTLVAIRRLNWETKGPEQWLAEVLDFGLLDHPNLVKLLGYCCEDGERGIQRVLVYQYMPNKSLKDHLFSRVAPALPWETRLEIILGAAQGLNYLHEGLEVQVIFCEFKSSNVLLDKDFKAKLSDFGIASVDTDCCRTLATTSVGTYGYAAPEYVNTGYLSSKSDIYSFGVVLYEVITGRQAVDRDRPSTEQKLLEWVKLYTVDDDKRFRLILDPEIRNQCSISSAKKIAKLADSCLSKNQNSRPAMTQVVKILKKAIEQSKEVVSDGNR